MNHALGRTSIAAGAALIALVALLGARHPHHAGMLAVLAVAGLCTIVSGVMTCRIATTRCASRAHTHPDDAHWRTCEAEAEAEHTDPYGAVDRAVWGIDR